MKYIMPLQSSLIRFFMLTCLGLFLISLNPGHFRFSRRHFFKIIFIKTTRQAKVKSQIDVATLGDFLSE